ncbi:MAG: shikimate dehydrogenase [Actinomycetota bacterium]|nr:shikimate dehydrogenase [Actinomycetota bacterium]
MRLGVVGWPVAHSRSPAIQNAALSTAGLTDWRYQRLPIPPELVAQTLRALPQAGFRGVNITIPHKQAALELATHAGDSARAIGAANTLIFGENGEMRAENTDAPALIRTLPFPAAGRTALVLGAGGSARACVWALLNAGAVDVRVWNRTAERARILCAEIGGTPVERATPADLLVHCTSTGLDASEDFFMHLPVTADALADYQCVVDLVYSEPPTALTRTARTRQLAVVDGLELLIAQGALSFELFTGRSAPVRAMRAALNRA